MLPVLLKPPTGRPARVLGAGPEILPAIQALTRVGWPVTLHDPDGGGSLKNLPGVQVATTRPPGPALRQASLVLMASGCPPAWRAAALSELEGSGVPLWDSAEPKASTLSFPVWFPGTPLSLALWGSGPVKPWEAGLAEDFLREMEAFYGGFVRLASELRSLVLDNMTDGTFREKIVGQLVRPEILQLLLKGEYLQAKTLALKIMGTTTRSLE